MLLPLLFAITVLSICNAFTPSSIHTTQSTQRITNNNMNNNGGDRIDILTKTLSTTTELKMAQRMTPTRKTRKEDSFDRGQNDDKEEEEGTSLSVCGVYV